MEERWHELLARSKSVLVLKYILVVKYLYFCIFLFWSEKKHFLIFSTFLGAKKDLCNPQIYPLTRWYGLVADSWRNSRFGSSGRFGGRRGAPVLQNFFRHFKNSSDGFFDRIRAIHNIRMFRLNLIVLIAQKYCDVIFFLKFFLKFQSFFHYLRRGLTPNP